MRRYIDLQNARSGVYSIRCQTSLYVGSSIDIATRWDQHRDDLAHGRHANYRMQNLFDRWGIDAFHFDVLEYTRPEQRWEREQHYISLLKPQINIKKIVEMPPKRPSRLVRNAIRVLRKRTML